MTEPVPIEPLQYELPGKPRAAVLAAVAVLLGGLGLIGLGGCFCIGIMITLANFSTGSLAPVALPPRSIVFLSLLYALAFGCFGGGIYLIVRGSRALFNIIYRTVSS